MRKSGKSLLCNIKVEHKVNSTEEKIYEKNCRDDYVAIYVTSGTGRYLVEGAEIKFYPGTLILIKPFEYYTVSIDSDLTYERYIIGFSLGAVADEAEEAFNKLFELKNGESGIFCSECLNHKAITEILKELDLRYNDCENSSNDILLPLLSKFILTVASEKHQKIRHDEFALPTRVISYINQYILKDVSLEVISKRFFLSKYYLCRMFKKHIGTTVHSYISQKRVLYAKEMIETGETASNAAYQVGFGDYSAFYRAYVKLVGKTPSVK